MFIFNAAQPGIGRVQVLGSKQVQGKHLVGFHQSSALTATKASNIGLECGRRLMIQRPGHSTLTRGTKAWFTHAVGYQGWG